MTIARAILTSMLVAGPKPLVAQAIRVADRVPVVLDLPGRPLGEPHLAVHPGNPRHLLGAAIVHDVTANLGDSTRSRIRCAAFTSVDDGRTWKQQLFDVKECFDPQVVITPGGRAVFSAIGVHPDGPQRADALLVFASPDGGQTWDARPVALGTGHDRPMLVTDRSSPERSDWVYAVSSQTARADNAILRFGVSVSRSRNGGRSFDPPVFLRPTTLMALAESPVVLSDGALLVPYVEPALGDGRTRLPRRRAYLLQSRDAGFGFSTPSYINEACGSDRRPFSLSFLAAGSSAGSSQERLYFACNQADPSEVVVSTSANRGESWTPARSIHGTPGDSIVRRKVMATAVNSRGVFGVVWMESGRNPGSSCANDVYFTASVDGGNSYLPAERLAREPSCATAATNGSGFAGDYFGLATDAHGRFRLLWSSVRERLLELTLATIEVADPPAAASPDPVGATGGVAAEQVVSAYLAAYNRHDVQGMARLADSAIVWLSIAGDSVTVESEGVTALREGLERYFRARPTARSTIEAMTSLGRWVTVHERAHWEGSGGPRSQAAVAVYEVENGRVRRVWYYPVARE